MTPNEQWVGLHYGRDWRAALVGSDLSTLEISLHPRMCCTAPTSEEEGDLSF